MSSGVLAISVIPAMTGMFWSAIAAPLVETAIGPSTSPSKAKANMRVRMAECLVIGSNVSQERESEQTLT